MNFCMRVSSRLPHSVMVSVSPSFPLNHLHASSLGPSIAPARPTRILPSPFLQVGHRAVSSLYPRSRTCLFTDSYRASRCVDVRHSIVPCSGTGWIVPGLSGPLGTSRGVPAMLQCREMYYAGSRAFCSIYLVGTSVRGSAAVEAFLWVVLALSTV